MSLINPPQSVDNFRLFSGIKRPPLLAALLKYMSGYIHWYQVFLFVHPRTFVIEGKVRLIPKLQQSHRFECE